MYTYIKQLYTNQQTPGQIFGIRTNGVSILKLSQHEQFGFKHKRQVEEPHWSKKCRVATLKGTSTEMHHISMLQKLETISMSPKICHGLKDFL